MGKKESGKLKTAYVLNICIFLLELFAIGWMMSGINAGLLSASRYYIAAALTHIQNGMIAPGYDWYGFFFAGARSVVIVLPIAIALTYGISVILWKWNASGSL